MTPDIEQREMTGNRGIRVGDRPVVARLALKESLLGAMVSSVS